MTMERRHFEMIADTLKDELQHTACGEEQRETVRSVAEAFARRLSATNDRFDRSRFLRACGVDQ